MTSNGLRHASSSASSQVETNNACPFPSRFETNLPSLSQDACTELADRASAEDRGDAPIAGSIAILRRAGLMSDDGAQDPVHTARTLMQVGAANLSVGRLWEGHLNALRLIRLYADLQKQKEVERIVARGGLLGVWGADAPEAVRDEDGTLRGAKLFASGLGTVTHALVTVNSGPEVQLALIEVTDPARADTGFWDMPGMRATASGRFDVDGLPFDQSTRIGGPGDYLIEPHFVGGVWRIAALQAGAAVGLLETAASRLRAADRLKAEAQKARLMGMLMQVWAGMALVERAALATLSTQPVERIVAASIAARLQTEETALAAISAVEQSLGLGHFAPESVTHRKARDLSVYLRQAARDAFLQRAADAAFSAPREIWGVFR